MEQCLKINLRKQAISKGIDVISLDKEFEEVGKLMKQARINVKKRRGWIKHFFIVLVTEFPIPRLEWTHPDEEKEYERLEKIKNKTGSRK